MICNCPVAVKWTEYNFAYRSLLTFFWGFMGVLTAFGTNIEPSLVSEYALLLGIPSSIQLLEAVHAVA